MRQTRAPSILSRRLGIAAAVTLAAFLSSGAHAEMSGGMFMGHNGSTIQEFGEIGSDRIEYRYSSVRPGLSAREGDVLFRGTKSSRGAVKGTAYVFKRGCPPAGYAVVGWQTNERVVLRGAAPVHAAGSCAVARHDPNAASSTLTFTIAE